MTADPALSVVVTVLNEEGSVEELYRRAAPRHRRADLGLRLCVQRLPAQRDRTAARDDRQAEVHEGARVVVRGNGGRGRRVARRRARRLELLALAAYSDRAARGGRLL